MFRNHRFIRGILSSSLFMMHLDETETTDRTKHGGGLATMHA